VPVVEDKRLIIFFAISLAIVVGWQAFVGSPASDPPAEPVVPAAEVATPIDPALEAVVEDAIEEAAEEAVASEPPVEATQEERVVIRTEAYRAELTNRGGQLVSFRLLDHLDEDEQPLDLVRRRTARPYPFATIDASGRPLALEEALFDVTRTTEDGTTEVVELRYRGEAGTARKRFAFQADAVIEIEIDIDGEEGWGVLLGPGILNFDPEENKGRNRVHSAVYLADGDISTPKSAKADELERIDGAGLSWIGLESTYFLTALMAVEPWREAVLQPVVIRAGAESKPPELTPFTDESELAEVDEDLPRDLRVIVRPRGQRLRMAAFFGAKRYERLRELGWGLEETVQWGMFGVLARPLLIGLEWIHDRVVSNYGWTIILMTLFLKTVLFPLTHKSHVSMLKMQKLQPRMQAIRQRWRGKTKDKKGRMNLEAQRQMNEEIQELFRQEGASPYGGCLPMLLQIPVFFAFFRLLLTAVELRHEPWVGWVQDLSAPDPIYLLPILMGASQVYQQKLTPMTGDPMQRRIMQMFPWIFMFVAFSCPSGLVLYWTTNNLLTIGQTMIFNRRRAARGEGGEGKSKSGKGKKGKKR